MILLHYGDTDSNTGIGSLPGELFGHRLAPTDTAVSLRATLALPERDFHRFITRLHAAITALTGRAGSQIARRALRRARAVADIDAILARTSH